eukprot:TRINITY_DN33892_c0_g1_i1.p1 TRINITY_DN33892_c0_g1~~TRINITY_DN33892_c0_g1_i1.p1  ORF type:complete len:797 (-),score=127.82 TRINITY_DN33892_c0_g1_i1:138-2528(-)
MIGLLSCCCRWVLALSTLSWVTADDDEESLTVADDELLCPEMDDENGQWSGSRHVGGNYTLRCAAGFEVVGKGGVASSSESIVCPSSLKWPLDLVCVNIDDCAKLKHGCGAMGVCLDLVDGYDCNCERGYIERRSPDGETVCGTSNLDETLCRGHTCSAYGLCVDLIGNVTEFDSESQEDNDNNGSQSAHDQKNSPKLDYRCECTEGFYDDGVTCQRYDCGEKHDALGEWTGSTLFGSHYTLQCPAGSYIWGGTLQVVTISCGSKGKWLSNPACVSLESEEHEEEMEALEYWTSIGSVILCVISAALAAGLTLGLATLEPFGLKVTLAARPEDCCSSEEREKLRLAQAHARKILPVLGDHHLLLVTLLLFNTVANEALPVFLSKLVPPLVALLMSVSVVLFCGEILPSAFFTGDNQLAIASVFVPFVRFLQLCFWCAAKPIALVLDRMITESAPAHSAKYSRAELKAMLSLHGPQEHTHGEEEVVSKESLGAFSVNCCAEPPETPPETEMVPARREIEQTMDDVPNIDTDPHEHDGSEHDGSDGTVLSKSELQLINGMLHSVKTTLSESRCYTPLKACFVASAQDLVDDIVVRLALADGHRSVLVLRDGSTASVSSKTKAEQQQDDDGDNAVPSTPMSPKLNVRASFVLGCLQVRDLLRNCSQPLHLLCGELLVLLPKDSTLLEGLRKMKNAGASSGLVVETESREQVVKGVVHMSEVLGQLISPHGRSRSRSTSSDIITPNPQTFVLHPPRSRLGMLARANTADMAASLGVNHRGAFDLESSGAYLPLRQKQRVQ